MSQRQLRQRYWKTNVRYVGVLLVIWFVVSYGCGILFVDELDTVRLGGFKLGFWFAQQGSIYTFVLLIVAYVILMNRLDRKLEQDERAEEAAARGMPDPDGDGDEDDGEGEGPGAGDRDGEEAGA